MEVDTVSIAEQHAPDIIQGLWWLATVLIMVISGLFALFLNSIKREFALLLKNINLQLVTLNVTVQSVKNEVAEDVALMRKEQEKLWGEISETKKRVNTLHTDVQLIKNNCDFYNGPNRRVALRRENNGDDK